MHTISFDCFLFVFSFTEQMLKLEVFFLYKNIANLYLVVQFCMYHLWWSVIYDSVLCVLLPRHPDVDNKTQTENDLQYKFEVYEKVDK